MLGHGHDDSPDPYADYFPDGSPRDNSLPRGAGCLWHLALLGGAETRGDLEALTVHPQAWGDYGWAQGLVQGRTLGTEVTAAVDAPDRLVYMHFAHDPAAGLQPSDAEDVDEVVLTLAKVDDGDWRVWGLGPEYPTAEDVFLD